MKYLCFLFGLLSLSALATDITPNPAAPGNLGSPANAFPNIYGTNVFGRHLGNGTALTNDAGQGAVFNGQNGVSLAGVFSGIATNLVVTTNATTAWVDPGGNDATAAVGQPNKPFANLSSACAAAGISNTIIVNPGDYYPAFNRPAVMLDGQTISGVGRPRFWWSWTFTTTSSQTTSNVACIVFTNNCTLSGIQIIATNTDLASKYTTMMSSYFGRDHFSSPGFTNVLVKDCEFLGQSYIFLDAGTNYMQSKWQRCRFASKQHVFWLADNTRGFSETEFDSCWFQQLDSGGFQNGQYKDIYESDDVSYPIIFKNCRFTDYAAVDDSSYQTWYWPSSFHGNGRYEYHNCVWDSGHFIFGDQKAAMNNHFYSAMNLGVDYVPALHPVGRYYGYMLDSTGLSASDIICGSSGTNLVSFPTSSATNGFYLDPPRGTITNIYSGVYKLTAKLSFQAVSAGGGDSYYLTLKTNGVNILNGGNMRVAFPDAYRGILDAQVVIYLPANTGISARMNNDNGTEDEVQVTEKSILVEGL